MNVKQIKRNARKVLKRHYLVFVAICVLSAFIGTEFSYNLKAFNVTDNTSVEEAGKYPSSLSFKTRAGNEVFGHSDGVLAQIINTVSSGTLYVIVTDTVISIINSRNIFFLILIVISMILMLAGWILIRNVFAVVSRRMFLEGRIYQHIPFRRYLFLFRTRKWLKASWTMFVYYVVQLIGWLTIIGGVVMRYAFYMVPYIIAENPDVGPIEALKLSTAMMRNNKWKCFLYELSFLGWFLIGVMTLGIFNIFYTTPYKMAFFSEYYAYLRQRAIDTMIVGSENLCDTYLYEKAPRNMLKEAYADVVKVLKEGKPYVDRLHGVKRIFAEWFGVQLSVSKKDMDYEASRRESHRILSLKQSVDGLAYPERLYIIYVNNRFRRMETIHYMRMYSIWSLIIMFFLFSLCGWLWEVSLHLVTDGVFVNRGFFHGPWLPIYGAGGILVLVALYRIRNNPLKEFMAIILMCGVVEYFTGLFLELANNGTKWWDYSGYYLNINGRICAEGLLVFGLGGMIAVYVVAPLLDDKIKKIRGEVLIPICVVLLVLFITDVVYSLINPNMGKGINDLNSGSLQDERKGEYSMSDQTSCEYCSNYEYDEDEDSYVCDVQMDEDDYGRMVSSNFKGCPYFIYDNEYKIVRHQM